MAHELNSKQPATTTPSNVADAVEEPRKTRPGFFVLGGSSLGALLRILVFWALLGWLFAQFRSTQLALSQRHGDPLDPAATVAESATPAEIMIVGEASIDDVGIPLTLSWEELSVTRLIDTGDGGKQVITTVRPVSGAMRPGELTAVMGGSGSGKSTLLRALMGRTDEAETRLGTMSINGNQVEDGNIDRLATMIGFVPQEDVMHDDLSVQENLQFSAEWRLDERAFPLPVRLGLVSDVLDRLGISKWKHDRVGRGSDTDKSHISGGQKKRVNIGIEMVADPGILFLDEPTSGLDSATTQKIVTELRNLAVNASLPVAAVLHQPSDKVFLLFTNLLLMARGGSTVYFGRTEEAVRNNLTVELLLY